MTPLKHFLIFSRKICQKRAIAKALSDFDEISLGPEFPSFRPPPAEDDSVDIYETNRQDIFVATHVTHEEDDIIDIGLLAQDKLDIFESYDPIHIGSMSALDYLKNTFAH